MVENTLFYTEDHEWVRIEGDEAVIGISDHAQHALGDITFVDLPKPGTTVKAHGALAVVESVKAASDIYAPVSGTVSAANEVLTKSPEKINEAALGDGWICRLKPFDAADLKKLMTPAQYDAFIAGN